MPIDGVRDVDKWAKDNQLSTYLMEANTQERIDFGKYDCGATNATSLIALPAQLNGEQSIRFRVYCREHKRFWVTAKRILGPNAIAITSFLVSFLHIILKATKAM